MFTEQEAQKKLIEKFSALEGKIIIPRQRRIFIDAQKKDFRQVLEYLKDLLGFSTLCAITGVDEGENFGIIYHLSNEQGVVLSIKINTPREKPEINTITDCFVNAQIYERELVDLFGINVLGLPLGCRYPLSDDWPKDVFPLRKDWKPEPKNR